MSRTIERPVRRQSTAERRLDREPNNGLPETAGPPAAGLRLHLNENTGGCSPKVLEAIRAISRVEVAFYPDYAAATTACARLLGVDCLVGRAHQRPGRRHLGGGGACLRAGDAAGEAIISEPAFDMYAACVKAVGGRLVPVPPRDDLAFPRDRILAAITPRTRLVFLCSPNNPSGLAIPNEDVEAVDRAPCRGRAAVPRRGVRGFRPRLVPSPPRRRPNVIVGRTFAKAYGLAALRIGCVVAQPEALRWCGGRFRRTA